MIDFQTCETIIRRLDTRLKPIAERQININDPDWVLKLMKSPNPLDEAGIRSEAESVLVDTIALYGSADELTRKSLRQLFYKCGAFAWAAALPFEPTTDIQFRDHLLHFSLIDLGKDSRDAILWLSDICKKARDSGIEIRPILEEVASISSDEDKYMTGSTKKLLLNAR